MKPTIEDMRDSFKYGYEAFESSRNEAHAVWEQFHNRQYTDAQLAVLANRGQPAETFNVIKLFARMLVGYYSTIVNTVVASPINPRDLDNAVLLNDAIEHTFLDNRFDILGDQIKLGGLVSGILACEVSVEDTGERDSFNRPINRINYEYVPDAELVLDPTSTKDDYSDATFLHRFKWLTGDAVTRMFGKGATEKLDERYNFLTIDEADFNFGSPFMGHYRMANNYLIVHTVLEETDGTRWSCHWSGEHILQKEEITERLTRFPYRVQLLQSSNQTEHYGIFREVSESQRAINQALIKLQLMVNSEKAYVEKGAVENIENFTTSFNRVNAVIEVEDLNGIKIDSLAREVQDQYIIIDKSLDRIQRILGVNDSFLGMAYASDSGRKVKLQQSATIMSLRYVTARIESFYQSLGEDTAKLIKQYYTANQVLMITDEVAGDRWTELNRPITEVNPVTGEETPVLLPEQDPNTGELLTDPEGNIILAPVNEFETELAYMSFKIRIDASAFNDEDEKAQLMLESVMSGQIGTMMSQVNPAGFFQMSALAMKSMKTKYSPNVVKVLEETAAMLGQNPQANEEAANQAQGGQQGAPQSRSLKIPEA